MSAEDVHDKIAAFQQQLETLQAAAASPGPSQGVWLEALQAFRGMLAELHGAEAALRDSEARSTAIVQTAVDGIITIDERGLIASFNPAAERLFGYTADEIIGHNIRMLMPPPYREEHDGYLARYLRTGEPHIIGIGRDVRGQHRDGTTFPMALAVSAITLDGVRLFTGIVHDLTARVQAEEALRQARDELEVRVQERTAELEAANEEVRRFAYIVSHDLRAPLVNLKGFASELRTATHVLQDVLPAVLPHLEVPQHADVAQALDQDIPEALDFIETSVTRMDHLIRAILQLSRLGHRDLHVEPLDMQALVQETVQTLAHQIAARQAQVTVELLPTVLADRTAMEQIMGNLLANAVAYLDPGRPARSSSRVNAGPTSRWCRSAITGGALPRRISPKSLSPSAVSAGRMCPGKAWAWPMCACSCGAMGVRSGATPRWGLARR
jgi:PAS domain S-box-containing protein